MEKVFKAFQKVQRTILLEVRVIAISVKQKELRGAENIYCISHFPIY